MGVNFYGAAKTTSVVKLPVINRGHLAKGRYGCGEPWVEVEYNGEVKQLVFNCGDDLDKAEFINLTIRKGLLGFDVIKDQSIFY